METSIKRNNVTLQDIADRVGVSKTTVSYLLSGGKSGVRISDETRQRVTSAAREMGYRPHAVARALARRRTDIITLVMQFPAVFSGTSSFISEMLRGVMEAANTQGLDVLLHTKEFSDISAEVANLSDGRIDGALILRDYDDPLPAKLHAAGLPCVTLFARSAFPEVASVDCDNHAGGQLAGEYLRGLGHRRLGFVGGAAGSSAVRDRRQGFTQALAQAGLCLHPEDTCTIHYTGADFAPLLERMRQENRPTALFCWSDDIATEVMRRLQRELNLRVPEDVSILGFDDSAALCERSVPQLSSIRQPMDAITRRAVELLANRIGATEDDKVILFAPTLTLRSSCAPPPPWKEPNQ